MWLLCDAVRGGGSEREQCCLLRSLPAFSHFPRYPQANWALLVLIPGWVGLLHPRPLWVSPMDSPVRLGVSPTAATPTGVFNQRFEALFSSTGTLDHGSVWLPVVPFCLSACECGTAGSTSHRLAGSASCCPSPPFLLVWMNVSSLTPRRFLRD